MLFCPEPFLGSSLKGWIVRVKSELVELTVGVLDDSVEEGCNFHSWDVMIDGLNLWGIPLVLIILNFKKREEEVMKKAPASRKKMMTICHYLRRITLSACLRSATAALCKGENSLSINSDTSKNRPLCFRYYMTYSSQTNDKILFRLTIVDKTQNYHNLILKALNYAKTYLTCFTLF